MYIANHICDFCGSETTRRACASESSIVHNAYDDYSKKKLNSFVYTGRFELEIKFFTQKRGQTVCLTNTFGRVHAINKIKIVWM